MKLKKVVGLLAVGALSVSCSQSTQFVNETVNSVKSYLFSTRPQERKTFVSFIQLDAKALLDSAERVNGQIVLNDLDKQRVQEEQDALIKRLSEISPEIKVLRKYRLVLNAVLVTGPASLEDQVAEAVGTQKFFKPQLFKRPDSDLRRLLFSADLPDLQQHNSATFIGVNSLRKNNVYGQGVKVGVIDTGIDYTHKMLGGPGTEDAYKGVNPNEASELFPNKKVVGGWDFAGTEFDAGADVEAKMIPHEDANPLDEAEHGTHVAGTIAGLGDGVNTYDGVAPQASLYALKVFGKEGSTADYVVIGAFEYAADPNGDLDVNDHLDVINLSLGGNYGSPKTLYSEATKNLVKAGTVVVASAGNSGDVPYIVGAPSTATEAISVAASVDDMPQNIVFKSTQFVSGSEEKFFESMASTMGKDPVASNVSGTLVYLGTGGNIQDVDQAVKDKVAGRIAFFSRGDVTFEKKFQIAKELNAKGVVVFNNTAGEVFAMGGSPDSKFDFPGIMISLESGKFLKEKLSTGEEVLINFSSQQDVYKPEFIDTITDFSSRGPRSFDSIIKPEIAAPGSNVISALCGSGEKGVQFSGTSMAGPHVAGVMALLKQGHPTETVEDLKARVVSTSKIMSEKDKGIYPVALQGAGRVQVDAAYFSDILVKPATMSLGEVSLSSKKVVKKVLKIKNTGKEIITLNSKVFARGPVTVQVAPSIAIGGQEEKTFEVRFVLNKTDKNESVQMDGFVTLSDDNGHTYNIPFLGVISQISDIKAGELKVQTDSALDARGASVELELKNNGANRGEAILFNLLGVDDAIMGRNETNLSFSDACDLQASGVRVIEKLESGKKKKLLQVAMKLYRPVTLWQPCDFSLQIDNNNDGVTDQELVGILGKFIPGVPSPTFTSVLLDAKLAREARQRYESTPRGVVEEDYSEAIVGLRPMFYYDHSTVAIVEAELSDIKKDGKGEVSIKASSTNLFADFGGDDFLGVHENQWEKINLSEESFSFYDMDESIVLSPGESRKIDLTKGYGAQDLLVLYPFNAPVQVGTTQDQQMQILKPIFRAE